MPIGSVALIIALSLTCAGCSFGESNDSSDVSESAILESTAIASAELGSEETEATEESSITYKIDTQWGDVELITIESADPEKELEPEDLSVEDSGYDYESMQAELASEESTEESQAEESTEASTEAQPETQAEPVQEETPKQPTSSDPASRVIDFATLQAKKNAHIYAWISVPGTNIDYPVLRHPTDNGYYLYHNLNGSQGYPGCIYTENFNSTEWTDPVTVLYGHDMRSTGTMFHQLHKFEKQSFFDQHEYFYIYTPEKTLTYHIFAAYVNSNEHLLGSHNFYSKDEFEAFFNLVKGTNTSVSHSRDVTVDSNSKVVALSTCIKNQPNNRYIIFGVLE